MMSNARSLLCAVPQPVADERKSGRRRFLHLTLTAGLLLGLQGLVAGPAAVATLPSALLARPVAASAAQPVMTGSVITASMDFTPKLMKEPGLFSAILEGAFTFKKPRAAKPAPQEVPTDEAAGDPDELIPFNGRTVPRWLVHSILKAAHVTGVDPVYMMTLADVESSLSPEAKAPTSSAQGLFQFIDSTWIETVYHHAADYGFNAAAEAIGYVNGELEVDSRHRD
jgi:hypothetical protein